MGRLVKQDTGETNINFDYSQLLPIIVDKKDNKYNTSVIVIMALHNYLPLS